MQPMRSMPHFLMHGACALQLTQAGKRLSPSDPDKSKAPSVTLPVWDMMRMLWRGQIGLTARSAHFPLYLCITSLYHFAEPDPVPGPLAMTTATLTECFSERCRAHVAVMTDIFLGDSIVLLRFVCGLQAF